MDLEMAAMKVDELERFLSTEFPQGFNPQSGLLIEAVWQDGWRVRQRVSASSVRPGGTISGPTMMALADFAMYVAVLAAIGPVALAVAINLNINFLPKPPQRALIAEARLLKLVNRLATGEILIRSHGQVDVVAQSVSTYSIPAGNIE